MEVLETDFKRDKNKLASKVEKIDKLESKNMNLKKK